MLADIYPLRKLILDAPDNQPSIISLLKPFYTELIKEDTNAVSRENAQNALNVLVEHTDLKNLYFPDHNKIKYTDIKSDPFNSTFEKFKKHELTYGQHDSVEALEYILNKIKDKSGIQFISFNLISKQTCNYAGAIEFVGPTTSEYKLGLYNLTRNSSILDLLNKSEQNEPDKTSLDICFDQIKTVNEYKEKYTESTRQNILKGDENLRLKESKLEIVFPEKIQYFMVHIFRGSPTDKNTTHLNIETKFIFKDIRWALQGAIYHSGSNTGGHYFYRKFIQAPYTFIEYNDSVIHNRTTVHDYNELCENAYILLYRKVDESEYTSIGEIHIAGNPVVNTGPVIPGSVTSSAISTSTPSINILPDELTQINQMITTNTLNPKRQTHITDGSYLTNITQYINQISK